MTFSTKENLIGNYIDQVTYSELINENKIIELLQRSLSTTIEFLSKSYNKKPLINQRKIAIGKIKREKSVNYGVKRSSDMIIIGDFIFNLHLKGKNAILYFIIVKEAFLHFFKSDLKNVDELIINIISILFYKEFTDINTFDNPNITPVINIYAAKVAEKDEIFWDNLLNILFIKNISFDNVFSQYRKIVESNTLSEEEIANHFGNWVYSLVKEEDVIAPIYLTSKLMPVIDCLLELGYDNATSTNLGLKLKLHQNTITSYLRGFTSTFFTFWRAVLNLGRLNLNNYFLEIEINKEDNFQKIFNLLLKIPYFHRLFNGANSDSIFIYSPLLTCPHIISEHLSEQLKKMQKEDIIKNYNLQLIREKLSYVTISTKPLKLTSKSFKELINSSSSDHLRKFIFSQEKKDFSMEFEDDSKVVDYNLLYFLSLIRGKFLLRGTYQTEGNLLEKFYEINKVPMNDLIARTDFLNQHEIRARKKGLLRYDLFMRNYTQISGDILVFQILTKNYHLENDLNEIIDKLKIFSFLGQINLYDRYVFTIPGVSYKHEIANAIEDVLKEYGLESKFYSIKLAKANVVPLHELFDFEEQKWKIIGQ